MMSVEAPPRQAIRWEPTVPVVEQPSWTYRQLLATMPESNQPMELWDGELIVMPAPTPRHQRVVQRLGRRLADFVEVEQLGDIYWSPIDVILSEHRVVQPDILFIANENLSIVRDRIRGAPDLVVEVISPGSWRRDRIDKRMLYEQYGVKEYWIADLEDETVDVLVWEGGAFRLHGRFRRSDVVSSVLLPGLTIAVDDLFAG